MTAHCSDSTGQDCAALQTAVPTCGTRLSPNPHPFSAPRFPGELGILRLNLMRGGPAWWPGSCRGSVISMTAPGSRAGSMEPTILIWPGTRLTPTLTAEEGHACKWILGKAELAITLLCQVHCLSFLPGKATSQLRTEGSWGTQVSCMLSPVPPLGPAQGPLMMSPERLVHLAGRGKLLWAQHTPGAQTPGGRRGGSRGRCFAPCHNGGSSFLFGDRQRGLLPCHRMLLQHKDAKGR